MACHASWPLQLLRLQTALYELAAFAAHAGRAARMQQAWQAMLGLH